MNSEADRGLFVKTMRENGVNQGACGAQSVRLRPSLYFTQKHADLYLSLVEKTIKQIA
jgi:4-aminobutyrate aminotransferase / (S)-3-amino-2-methylpropionate transaminase